MSASVGKAGHILRVFASGADTLTIRALADATGLPRSTVHLLCRTLVEEELLESVAGGGYRLGSMILQLGGRVIDRSGLVEAAEGSTAGLRRSHGQEIHVGQLVDGWIVYLHRESGPSRVAPANRVGMRAPAFLSGCGKSGLSVLNCDDAWNRVQRSGALERIPLPDKDSLLSELAEARSQGYIVSRSFQQGWTSVAAAVVGKEGVVGGLSITGPSNTFQLSRIHEVGEAVAGAATTASRRLLGRRGRQDTWRSVSGYAVRSSCGGVD